MYAASLQRHALRALLVFCTSLWLAACASDGSKPPPTNPFQDRGVGPGPDQGLSDRELRMQADELYRSARSKLDSGDYLGAIELYTNLRTRFPFSDFAQQAQLETVYAHYRAFQPDQAQAAADRFLREHPHSQAVPYMIYLRGMINFERNKSFLDGLDLVDTTKRDVTSARQAFDDFSQLVGRFPDSPYAADARKRMIWLRNRIARNEMHVVDYYYKRGAWLAAARRAEGVIANYPGAPAALDAVEMLTHCYANLGLREQASTARSLLAEVEPLRAEKISVEPREPLWSRLWPFGDATPEDDETEDEQETPPA